MQFRSWANGLAVHVEDFITVIKHTPLTGEIVGRLAESEISEKLKALRDWNRHGSTIVKHYKFPSFRKAIKFVNKVSDTAEELNHHPTIVINYNRVTLSLTTHSQGGLTENDFLLATRIDTLLQEDTDLLTGG